jgi:hypothetical protein
VGEIAEREVTGMTLMGCVSVLKTANSCLL